ncbi:MAG: cell envelope integrity protein TolA [Holosporales bacterium]|jgi:outer membrane biosynthesis protein TonB|nr:cell envelope integrity protein TolA [Holosporales bacterium]
MNSRLALLISIGMHCFAAIIGYINYGGFFSEKIKDSGYTVFDFVEIGQKSRAPVLSSADGRVSKIKTQNTDKDAVTNEAQPTENNIEQKETSKSEEAATDKKGKDDDHAVPMKPRKEKHPPKKPNKKKGDSGKKTNKPKPAKTSKNKAIVNLNKNKRKKSDANPLAAKRSFDSLLNSVTAKAEQENSGINAEEVGETLTATQIDLVRQTIRKCWHFPAGLKDAETLVVDIKMELDPNGNVKKAEIIDKERMNKDPNFRIAAENARRAVLDPECNPLPFPKNKYEEWKDLELSFNPREMFE